MTSRRERKSPADWDRAQAVGRAVAANRAERGLSRGELAELAGISYTHLSEIENGKKEPSSRTLAAIAEGLRIRPGDLVLRADSLLEADLSERAARPDELDVGGALRFEGEPLPPPSERHWFHERTMPAMRAADAVSAKRNEIPDALVEELLALARQLPREDLERLLDLARRLKRPDPLP